MQVVRLYEGVCPKPSADGDNDLIVTSSWQVVNKNVSALDMHPVVHGGLSFIGPGLGSVTNPRLS